MMEAKDIHTVGGQVAGFDYQFYFFVLTLLKIKQGEKVGFEVLDDVHVENNKGVINYQLKHSVLTLKDGSIKNLSSVDSDLWKTIKIWTDKVKTLKKEDIINDSYILFTNKNANNGNLFIDALSNYKQYHDIISFKKLIEEIKSESVKIKEYKRDFLELSNEQLESFISNITIVVGKNDLEKEIVDTLISKNYQNREQNEQLLFLLLGNLIHLKFKKLKKNEKCIIDFEEFQKIGKRIFDFGLSKTKLPKVNYFFEEKDFKDFLFIKQLEDIEILRIKEKEKKVELITKYFSYKNSINVWQREMYIMPTDINDLEDEAISKWKNCFESYYGFLSIKGKKGLKKKKLLKTAHKIHQETLKEVFEFNGYNKLTIDISNGLIYNLSEQFKIGWKQDWEKIYKK